MMFCNHFGVKSLRLGTFFLPFLRILIFSCLRDAGTFKLAFCFETYFFLSYSPKYLFYLRTTWNEFIGQFVHFVWLKCVSCKQNTFLHDAGTICLSWASFVHEKLVCRELVISWWFFFVPLLFQDWKYMVHTFYIHWSTVNSLLKISFIMSQCRKMAHEITVPAHSWKHHEY